jgi:putative oxidoreductase
MKKLFSTKYTDNGVSFSLLILRLVFAGLLIPVGYQKLTHFASMSKMFPDPFGIGHAPSLALVVFAEFFCAVMVLAGFMTRLACIPIIISMSVALFSAHHGEVFGEGGKATLFLAAFLVILFTGPGKASIDRLIGK